MISSKITLSSPTDILDAVPALLGFVPEDSLTLICLDGPRVAFTARVDLAHALACIESLYATSSSHGTRVVIVTHTTRANHGAPEVNAYRERLDVFEAIATDSQRWWSLTCPRGDNCCPPEGTPPPATTSATTAALVAAGVATLPNRDALAALIAPPPAGEWSDLATLHDIAVRAEAARSPQDQINALVQFVSQHTGPADGRGTAPDRTGTAEAVAALHADLTLRNRAIAMLDRSNARQHADLWAHVIRHTHPEHAALALALYGLASWIDGNGAAANIASARLADQHPTYTLGYLLNNILSRALPPAVWDSLAADLRADLAEVTS